MKNTKTLQLLFNKFVFSVFLNMAHKPNPILVRKYSKNTHMCVTHVSVVTHHSNFKLTLLNSITLNTIRSGCTQTTIHLKIDAIGTCVRACTYKHTHHIHMYTYKQRTLLACLVARFARFLLCLLLWLVGWRAGLLDCCQAGWLMAVLLVCLLAR